MKPDLLDLYERGSEWTLSKVEGATDKLDATTPCDEWNVRTLLNHMLETQRYFVGAARGNKGSRPSPHPPDLVGDDPVADFEQVRSDMLRAFGEPGVIDQTGLSLGIASSDLLLHGWDLARATGQDASMPEGLPEGVYEVIHGKLTDEQRTGIFKPEVTAAGDASAQDRLLAYTGRDPAG